MTPKKKMSSAFVVYFLIEIFVIFLSVVIPFNIIRFISHNFGCTRHNRGGLLWMVGRTLGFTSLIWFLISSFQGILMNKHAKLFHSKKRARDLHCLSSFLAIIMMFLHFYILFISEPWRSIVLRTDRAHFPQEVFRLKIILGIIFGTIMTSVSVLSVLARNPKIMKKIGYKRFKWIHWFMMVSTIILIIHVIYINTELWIMGFGRFS